LHLNVMSMDYELAAFFLFVAVVAFMLHWRSRRFLLVSFGVPVLCSVASLWCDAWIRNYEVNVAWAPFVLIWLYAYALPTTLVVGLAFLILRSRCATRKPAKMSVADEL